MTTVWAEVDVISDVESKIIMKKDSGITILGFGKGDSDGTDGAVAVNAFLWRAALDTISFMPLASADPYGGIIISDWHALPESPDERFKVNIYYL